MHFDGVGNARTRLFQERTEVAFAHMCRYDHQPPPQFAPDLCKAIDHPEIRQRAERNRDTTIDSEG